MSRACVDVRSRFKAGQRVQFTDWPGDSGLGTVEGIDSHLNYVRIRFDNGHTGICNPQNVRPIGKDREE